MMSSSFMVYFLSGILLLTSLFMILLVLIQRGRGGGLAGAFGGMGGQSAFGTRAGDIFTKITVVVAVLFILVAALLGQSMRASQRAADTGVSSGFSGPSEADLKTEDDTTVTPGIAPVKTGDAVDDPFAEAEAGAADAEDSSVAPDPETDETPDETGTPTTDEAAEPEPTEPEPTEPEPAEPEPAEPEPAEPEPDTEPADDTSDEDRQGTP